jgi:Flp pilus assembly protein TadD
VHVECVAGLVGRAELWCAGGVVGAIVLMLSPRGLTPLRVAGIVACLLFAMGSKEQAILLPFFLWGLSLTGLWRAREPGERKRAQVLALILCWVTAGYIVAREASPMKFSWDRAMLDWTAQPLIRASAADRWGIVLEVLGRYAELLVGPARLSLDYGYRVTSYRAAWSSPYVYAGLAVALASGVALGVAWRRGWRVVVWCLLCAAATYAMVGNVTMPIGTIMGERLMYLPSVFLMVLAGYAMTRLPGRAYAVLLAVLTVAGAARSIAYARLWTDPLALYQQQVRVRPESVAVRHLLAQEWAERGDYAQAMAVMEEAARATPDYWGTPFFAAKLALKHGDYAGALRWADRAGQIEPNDPTAVSFFKIAVLRRQAGIVDAPAGATTRP